MSEQLKLYAYHFEDFHISFWWEILCSKLLGNKRVVHDGSWELTYYEYRGVLYIADIREVTNAGTHTD